MASFIWPPQGGSGTTLSIGTIDTGTPSANGAQILSSSLILQSASVSVPGLVNLSSQTFAGDKTFNGSVDAASLILSGSTSGKFTQTIPSIVSSYFVSWPATQGASSTFLKNDGSGGLSWAAGTGASGVDSVGTYDSQSPNSDGSTISGTTIYFQSADSTNPGMVSNTTQSFAGDKTFTGNIAANNLSGTNTGNINLTAVGSSPNGNAASLSGQALTLQPADATHPGVLTATDWNTFNSKGSGTVTSLSVASANGFAGTVANATTTPAITLTIPATGVLKSNGTAVGAATSGTDYSAGTSGLSTGILKSTTSTGALTIAIASDFPTLNQNTTGTASNVTGTVALNHGGTGVAAGSANAAFNALSPLTSVGGIIIGGVSGAGTELPIGANGTVLTAVSGSPSWQSPAAAVVAYNITNQTTAYSAAPNDLIRANYDTIGAFVITMPDATINSGKSVIIENVSTGYNSGTIVFVGGQSARGLTTLHCTTPGELWELTSNGVDYDVTSHLTDTFTNPYTVLFGNTSGPAPTRGTIGFELSSVSRRGRRARLVWNINQTGGGNNNGGGGYYTYSLPFTADTSFNNANPSTTYDGTASAIGSGSLNSISNYKCTPALHSTTLFKIWLGDTAGTYQSVVTGSWDTSPLRVSVVLEFEVQNWED